MLKKKRKYDLKAADDNDRIRNSSKIYYSSEIWGLWYDESLPYSWNMKTQIVFSPFSFWIGWCQYDKFCSILLDNFIKHKILISE